MVDEDLPAQPPHGISLILYTRLRIVYILGFLECLVGAAVIVIEATSIGLFHNPEDDASPELEVAGILVGILVVITGAVNFYAGRNGMVPQTRRKLFTAGIVLCLLSLVAVGAMLTYSALRTYHLYADVADKEGRANSAEFRKKPYTISLEGLRHAAQPRAMAAAAYALSLLFLVTSLGFDAVNVRKNKENAETATVYSSVPKEEVKLGKTNKATDL